MTKSMLNTGAGLRNLFLAGACAIAFTGVAVAQEDDSDDPITTDTPVAESSDEKEIVVIGSRIKRQEFTSIAPVQIISTDVKADLGQVDATSILQGSTVSAGQQIDASFAGFVLDNGPGATTADLRGLGAGRTLALLNGRRLAPAGVEGAPTSPDLSLVPTGLVESFNLLLDGASSIYGSDAVAGVIDAQLRTDFDGFEFDLFRAQPSQEGGEETQINIVWGANNDRGSIGFGAEYYKRERIGLNDRDFSEECARHFEITESGEIRSTDLGLDFDRPGMGTSECRTSSLVGRVLVGNRFSSIYYTPGSTNTGIPNFSEDSQFLALYDADGDGQVDFSWRDYSLNGTPVDRAGDLIAGTETMAFMSYGDYTIDWFNGATLYYEALYSQRETFIDSGAFQLFPDVPANNPFNICNPNGIRGVDCQEAYENSLLDPNYVANFTAIYGVPPTAFGFLFPGTRGAISTLPIVNIPGDRTTTEVDLAQYRLVGGMKGELPFGSPFVEGNWDFDVYGVYSKSSGTSVRRGVRDDRLTLSLTTTIEDPSNPGNFICGLDVNGDDIPDPDQTPGGCVPIDMFAPSLYSPLNGSFATQEEHDYLFGVRSFDTTYEQTILAAFATGDLFQLPDGIASGAIGFEYRQDKINSDPDDVARDGLFFGFFSDGGASGSKDLYEAFAEVELPLAANRPGIYELTTNLSARWTEEQYYGAAWTYSAKLGYRPVDWLQLAGTAGTSFRAPNVREQFLRGQTGFLTLTDPCVVPGEAVALGAGYNRSQDPRDDLTLNNCRAAGIDPETHDPNGNNSAFFSTEIVSGGGTDLHEETSESFTGSITVEQPWYDQFDLSLRVTYYDITIEGAIAEPSSQFIINDCFSIQPNLSSAFCSRITRDNQNALQLINATPVNIDEETASGVDISVNYSQDINLFEREWTLLADVDVNHKIDRKVKTIDDNGQATVTDLRGRFGFAEWTATGTFGVNYDDFRFRWSTRYIGDVQQPDSDDFANVVDGGSDTCLGPTLGDENCRDVDFADAWFTHDASLRYDRDTWYATFGVRNVFDEKPPFVDSSEYTTNGANVPLGAGYNSGIFGRTFFVRVSKEF